MALGLLGEKSWRRKVKPRTRNLTATVISLLLFDAVQPCTVNPQGLPPISNTDPGQDSESAANQSAKDRDPASSKYYLSINAGKIYTNTNDGKIDVTNWGGGGPIEWGFSFGRYLSRTVSVQGNVEWWGERYERQSEQVIVGTGNNIIEMGGIGLSVNAKLHYRHERYNAYVGAGVGYYSTTILIADPGTGLLTDVGAPSNIYSVGYECLVGIEVQILNKIHIGIELRQRFLQGDFGEYTDGKVDLGGTMLLLILRGGTK